MCDARKNVFRSKLRREKLRAQLVDEILAEANHTSTVRILEYRPITLQNDVQTAEEHGGASRCSAIACEHVGPDHAELRTPCSQDGTIGHVAACDMRHLKGDGETQCSCNMGTFQDITDTAHQQAVVGSSPTPGSRDDANFIPLRQTRSTTRVRLHRDRKRDERLRQYSLEAEHSQGRVRVLSSCVNAVIPQLVTESNPILMFPRRMISAFAGYRHGAMSVCAVSASGHFSSERWPTVHRATGDIYLVLATEQ